MGKSGSSRDSGQGQERPGQLVFQCEVEEAVSENHQLPEQRGGPPSHSVRRVMVLGAECGSGGARRKRLLGIRRSSERRGMDDLPRRDD